MHDGIQDFSKKEKLEIDFENKSNEVRVEMSEKNHVLGQCHGEEKKLRSRNFD